MKQIRIGDFTIAEFVDVETYFRNTGLLDYRLEDLQDFTLNATQEDSNITGRGGRVIGKKKKNKSASGSGTSGVISPGLFRTQTGGDIKYGETLVKRAETKVVSGKSTTVITDAVAVGTEGEEIGEIKLFVTGGRQVASFKQGVSATKDTFSYDPETKTITLPDSDDIEAGMSVVYAYKKKVNATVMNNPSNKFSEVREMWVHCFATDTCDNVYCADIYIPRADFKGDFSFGLGGDQVTHNFSFDALPDFCNLGGDDDLFKIFVYTDDTAKTSTSSATTGGNNFADDSEVQEMFPTP